MINNQKVTLILPCYNEEGGLRSILDQDLSFIDEVIVVDNDSIDGTAAVAKEYGCTVVHEKKKGYGAAYQAGLKQIKEGVIIAMDGDGTYPLETARDFILKIITSDIDFISGNRLSRGKPASMPYLNYLGNIILTLVIRILFIKNCLDSQSGMWVFRQDILNHLHLISADMAFSQEIKIETVARKFKFIELPIDYRKRAGQVKLRCFRDGFRNLMFLFKIFLG